MWVHPSFSTASACSEREARIFRYTKGVESGKVLEAANASEAARNELNALRRRAAELEASLKAESPKTVPEIGHEAAQRAVGERWQQAVEKPSPGEMPRVAHHPDAISLQLSA